ncbi:MAG: hypothetical protein ACTSVY_11835, partial [Candidatus Helarchaeota archaeon]
MSELYEMYLEENEIIKNIIICERKETTKILTGNLVLTNYRLLFFKSNKPIEREDFDIIDSIPFDDIYNVLINKRENWIKINDINYRPSVESPSSFVSLLEKLINEQPEQKIQFRPVENMKKYSTKNKFFDFLGSIFTIPILSIAIVGLSFFAFSFSSVISCTLGLCICGIIFSALLFADERKYPYYTLEGSKLKIRNDKRSVILGLSIAGVVFSSISSAFTSLEYVNFDNSMLFSLINIRPFIGFIFGMLAILFSISITYEMSNIFQREPKWIGSRDSPLSTYSVEKFNKTAGGFSIVLLSIALGLFILYQGEMIGIFYIPYVQFYIWYVISITLKFISIIISLCAFGFLIVRDILFLISFMFGLATKVVTQISDYSKNSIRGFLDKVKENAQKIRNEMHYIFTGERIEPENELTEADTIEIETEDDVISTPVGIKEENTTIETEGKVEVTRGGIIKGGKYVYKVKVSNNTSSVITDIKVLITSFPSDSLV